MNLYIKMEKIGKYFFKLLKQKDKGWCEIAYFRFFILIYDFVLLIYILFIRSVFIVSPKLLAIRPPEYMERGKQDLLPL